MNKDSHQAHDESAADYDRLARKYRWFGPEALFGLCFEYVQPGERLLAIGIGTGAVCRVVCKLPVRPQFNCGRNEFTQDL